MTPMNPGPSVGIIMLSWGQADLTRKCVNSVIDGTSPELYKLFWVRNELEREQEQLDGWVRWALEANNVAFKEFHNEENLGFAKGVNQALQHILENEPHITQVCLLNNDTEVPMNWLYRLLVHMPPEYGALGPLTNNGGFQRFHHMANQYPGEVLQPRQGESWLHYSRRVILSPNKEVIETSELAFFCTVIPVSVVKEIGMLDERFGPAFGEDNDYCIRIRNAGYKIGVTPNVVIHHAHGGTFKMSGLNREQAHQKAQRILKEKWE